MQARHGRKPVCLRGQSTYRKSEKLLAESGKTIKEIACAVGFPDQNYFSVAFKRAVGVPPSDYRKAYRG
ncbi:MAG: helix-turn-helix domain-containing protein [Christensenellales bacterium]